MNEVSRQPAVFNRVTGVETRRPSAVWLWGLLAIVGCGPNSGSAPSLQDLREIHTNAVKAIESKQGTVEEKKYAPGNGYAVSLKNAEIDDDDIAVLHAINGLAELDLSGSTITDEQLAALVAPDADGGCPVPVLFKLDLSGTPITDNGLRELQALRWLAELNVKGSQVTAAGIQELEQGRASQKLPFGMKFTLAR